MKNIKSNKIINYTVIIFLITIIIFQFVNVTLIKNEASKKEKYNETLIKEMEEQKLLSENIVYYDNIHSFINENKVFSCKYKKVYNDKFDKDISLYTLYTQRESKNYKFYVYNEGSGYSISYTTLESGERYNIEYPQIYNESASKTNNIINNSIRDRAFMNIDETDKNVYTNSWITEINYDIPYRNNNIVSIRFTGDNTNGIAVNTLMRSINIDLSTGNEILIGDVINNFEIFGEILTNNLYRDLNKGFYGYGYSDDAPGVFEHYTQDTFIEDIKQCGFCFKEDALGIYLSYSNLRNMESGYIEVDYKYIEDYINEKYKIYD